MKIKSKQKNFIKLLVANWLSMLTLWFYWMLISCLDNKKVLRMSYRNLPLLGILTWSWELTWLENNDWCSRILRIFKILNIWFWECLGCHMENFFLSLAWNLILKSNCGFVGSWHETSLSCAPLVYKAHVSQIIKASLSLQKKKHLFSCLLWKLYSLRQKMKSSTPFFWSPKFQKKEKIYIYWNLLENSKV